MESEQKNPDVSKKILEYFKQIKTKNCCENAMLSQQFFSLLLMFSSYYLLLILTLESFKFMFWFYFTNFSICKENQPDPYHSKCTELNHIKRLFEEKYT